MNWKERLDYPTRTVTFDTQPDVKEYILSYDEIQELNKDLIKKLIEDIPDYNYLSSKPGKFLKSYTDNTELKQQLRDKYDL